MDREDLIPTHWKSDILKSLKPGLVDKWNNYAVLLCKNRDLKAYLAYRQNNICPWCGNNLYNDGKNYPVIHHISYSNLCTGNVTNSFYNGEIISIPNCLNCDRLSECTEDLVIVHTKCNEEINNCQKKNLKSSEDIEETDETYESFKTWLDNFKERYKDDFPQDIVSISNYLAVIFYEYQNMHLFRPNDRLSEKYFNNKLLWRVYSGVWFYHDTIKQYLIKHDTIKEEKAFPLVQIIDRIIVNKADYDFSRQCIKNFYDLLLYPKEQEKKKQEQEKRKKDIENKFAEKVKQWRLNFEKSSYKELYHLIIEEDYTVYYYEKNNIERNALCYVIEKEHPDFYTYCLDNFPKGLGTGSLLLRRLNKLVSFGPTNTHKKLKYCNMLDDKDLFYRYLELGYCKLLTNKSTVNSFYKVSEINQAIEDGYRLSKTLVRQLSDGEKQEIIKKYPVFEKLFVL